MDSNETKGYRYKIGPGPELLQEIGQILVNYSECERAIYNIFKSVMSLSEEDAYLLVKYGNINPEKMLAIVLSKHDRIMPPLLRQPLKEAVSLFKGSIELRNEVAHWQWAITDGKSGLAFNSIKSKPEATGNGKTYELSELQKGAWRLAKSAVLLNQIAVSMFAEHSSKLSCSAWAPCNYNAPRAVDELMVEFSLSQTRKMLDRVEAELEKSAQPPFDDIARR